MTLFAKCDPRLDGHILDESGFCGGAGPVRIDRWAAAHAHVPLARTLCAPRQLQTVAGSPNAAGVLRVERMAAREWAGPEGAPPPIQAAVVLPNGDSQER